MPIMSVRLSEKEAKLILTLAKEEEKEKSTEARELMMDGVKYKMLLAYKQGKVSTGSLAKKLELSLSDLFDLLASLGIPAPISYDDYLQGFKSGRQLFSK